jgi:hypothetical protein
MRPSLPICGMAVQAFLSKRWFATSHERLVESRKLVDNRSQGKRLQLRFLFTSHTDEWIEFKEVDLLVKK